MKTIAFGAAVAALTGAASPAPFGWTTAQNTSCESIEEAQDHATQWLWTYSNDRPNMGIAGITPAQKLKTAA